MPGSGAWCRSRDTKRSSPRSGGVAPDSVAFQAPTASAACALIQSDSKRPYSLNRRALFSLVFSIYPGS